MSILFFVILQSDSRDRTLKNCVSCHDVQAALFLLMPFTFFEISQMQFKSATDNWHDTSDQAEIYLTGHAKMTCRKSSPVTGVQ